MEWTAEVAAGDWLRERVDDPWQGTMHDVVPRGFPSYTRIFHPATRSKPVGVPWPPLPYDRHRREWEAFAAQQPEIETLPARWADAAAAFGTRMHGTAQWGALVRASGAEPDPNGWQQRQAPDGWQFDAPEGGRLDPAVLSVVAGIAAAHTSTPVEGSIALWEGWGGIVGAMGYGPSRAILTFSDDGEPDAATARHENFLAHSVRDVFNDVFRKPTWQPGVLSDEVSRGPRFALPNRDYVLFRGGATELADPEWPLRAPWRDRELEEHGFTSRAESPSLVWPADRAWVIVSEIDWDTTIVAGPHELARALCADPRLEALGVREGVCLHWDGDEVNR